MPLLTLLLVCCGLAAPDAARGQNSTSSSGHGFRQIAFEPARLASGSPCLLTVTLDVEASSMMGEWNHQKISFFRLRSAPSGKTWLALLGVDVETPPGAYPLSLEAATADGSRLRATRQITVEPAQYRSSEIRVEPNFVEPNAEAERVIAADKAIKDRVFAQSAALPQWTGNFAKPVTSPATDSFGTRRTFNGKLASIHRGMDFRAAAGTPVDAANSGTVVIAQKLFYEGNCVVIDHGLGVWTIYMHFSRIDVAAGQQVKKGERLGLSGATGRVTGPHLHFAVRWQRSYLDPAGLFRLGLAGEP